MVAVLLVVLLPPCCRQCWGLLCGTGGVLMRGHGTQLEAHGWHAVHCLAVQCDGSCVVCLLQTSLGCPTS